MRDRRRSRLRVLVAAVGTMGDVLPAAAVGRLMAARGHEVILVANETFAGVAAETGLGFEAVGTRAEFEALISGPSYAIDGAPFAPFAKAAIVPLLLPMLEAVARLAAAAGGETVVVAGNYAYGARYARALLGVPTVNVAIQPAMFRGTRRPAACPPRVRDFHHAVRFAEAHLPAIVRRDVAPRLRAAPSALSADEVARRLGAPTRERFVGLFPRWFSPPTPDWPQDVTLTGFPLADADAPLDPRLEAFLADDDAEPPVVLFCGSYMKGAERFFETAAAACARLGRRAVAVSRFAHGVEGLAGGRRRRGGVPLLVVPQAPFSVLLPRAAAIVHHGGIGTIAQALTAGIPQIAVPLCFEQPDNAAVMAALGVGEPVWLGAGADALATALARRLADPDTRLRCGHCARRMREENPFEAVAGAIEMTAAAAA